MSNEVGCRAPSPVAAQLAALAAAIGECLLADRARLTKRVRRLCRHDAPPPAAALDGLAQDIARSRGWCQRRAALPLRLTFPPDLPFSEHAESIAALITRHRVVIISGETGCGKSTQLPKLCLALGRGVAGRIGHTQPRRLAARAIAARVAEETATRAGEAVGHCIRFDENLAPSTRVKVMTDGILLHEIDRDPLLLQYDTLIIDEVHERSLNIDFLLGYLERLQVRRHDLKLILTSATMDAERFAGFFDDAVSYAIAGRAHPIALRYQPPPDDGTGAGDAPAVLAERVRELLHEAPGDILVFLPGEREIGEAEAELTGALPADLEILPLFARMSAARQARVFAPGAARRVILATNVAETALTVPRVRHVIDSGLARVSRYSPRRKLQVLQVERIAQANADQRAGRCGRQAPGICVRLYSEADFTARRACAEPEIQRTNLAGVILRLKALGVDDVDHFPFVDPPPARLVKDGHALLQELGALGADGRLSATGRRLLRFPIDPRLGRVLVAASEFGCLAECLVIVAALSIVDPRERPHARRAAADEAHAAFADRRSDFLWFWRAWPFVRELMTLPPRRRARRAERRFLSATRLREWVELHDHLARLARVAGLTLNAEPAAYKRIHTALAAGFATQIGAWQGDHYSGCRNLNFVAHPASVLARHPARWVLAGEVVETERRYARSLARIEPAWLERAAGDLLKRNWEAPHWDARRGAVRATEIQRLFGLVINAAKLVDFARIDPPAARAIFIDVALIDGQLGEQPAFLRHNLALVEQVRELETRARRRDLLAPRTVLQAFYAERLPPAMVSRRDLLGWLRADPAREPTLLMREGDVTTAAHAALGAYLFPDRLEVAGSTCALSYRYAPGELDDGLTVEIPLALLPRVQPQQLERLVPGLLSAKVEALLRTLPKALRRQVSPLREFAMACVEAVATSEAPLADALADALERMTGCVMPPSMFDGGQLPAHLACRIAVVAEDGSRVGLGRDLAGLKAALAAPAAAAWTKLDFGIAGRSSAGWTFPALPPAVYAHSGAHQVPGYPALVAALAGVELRVFETAVPALHAHRLGVAQLLVQVSGREQRALARAVDGDRALALRLALFGHAGSPAQALLTAAARRWAERDAVPRDAAAFAVLAASFAHAVVAEASTAAALVGTLLARGDVLRTAVREADIPPPVRADVLSQLAILLGPTLLVAVDAGAGARVQRYLSAIERRLDRVRGNPGKDGLKLATLAPLWQRYLAVRAERGGEVAGDPLLFLFEDCRVGLFAPELGGPAPIDPATLAAALDAWAASAAGDDARP